MARGVGSRTASSFFGTISPEVELDYETRAWVSAAISNGGSVSAYRQVLVDRVVKGLKADGIWTTLDRLWLFAAENAGGALVDIVARAIATAVDTPTFAVDRGYTGNGSSSYIDSNFNPSTGGFNYVQNSAALFGWSNTSGTDNGGLIGTATDNVNQMFPKLGFDNNTYWCVNSNGTDTQVTAGIDGNAGLWTMTRTGATANRLDYNGAQIDTFAGASAALVNQNIYALRRNTLFSARQICCLGFGSQLSTTQSANLYTRIRAYMTAVGVP